MNDLYINTLVDIAYDFIHILALLALLLSLVVGLALIFNPARVMRWNTRFQKTYSMRQQTRILEDQHHLDHYFYRHHHITGTIISLISAYIFYYFSVVFKADMFVMIFSGYSHTLVLILADWLRILMLFVSTLTLIIGITILLRPSGLKSFEAWANRWISTRKATRPLVEEYQHVDQMLLRHPRMLGVAVVVLSIYSVISLILIYN